MIIIMYNHRVATENPINLTQIHGCMRVPLPAMERSGDKVLCKMWKDPTLSGMPFESIPLDEVDETKGTASCYYSKCYHCVTLGMKSY